MKVVHYRLRGSVLMLLIAVAVTVAFQTYRQRRIPGEVGPDLDQAATRTYYRIGGGQSFTAELSPHDSLLRVASILAAERGALVADSLAEALEHPYALRLELLDAGFATLRTETVHLATRKTRLVGPDGAVVEPAFMDDARLMLLDPRWFSLPAAQLAPNSLYLRISLEAPAESTAFLRCFRREAAALGVLGEEDLLAAWEGETFDAQEHAASANLFPSSVIAETEKARLMANRWVHVPGWGLPGRDHVVKTIFRQTREQVDEARSEARLPGATWVDEERDVAWQVTGPQTLRLRGLLPPGQAAAPLTVRWTLWTERSDGFLHAVQEGRTAVELVPEHPAGLLDLPVPAGRHWLLLRRESGAPEAEVLAEVASDGIEHERTWEGVADAAEGGAWYGVGGEEGVVFDLPLSRDGGTGPAWYRLEARWAQVAEAPSAATAVQCQWLDVAGKEIGSTEVDLPPAQDRLAWAPGRELRRLGRAMASFLRPPADARVLRLQAGSAAVVRVFARPASVPLAVLARPLADEDEAVLVSGSAAETASAWHQVRPQGHRGQRHFLRRPDCDPEAAAAGPPELLPAWRGVVVMGAGEERRLLWPVAGVDRSDRELIWNDQVLVEHEPGRSYRPLDGGLPLPGLPGWWRGLEAEQGIVGRWDQVAGDSAGEPAPGTLIGGLPEGGGPPARWWRLLSAAPCPPGGEVELQVEKVAGIAAAVLLHLAAAMDLPRSAERQPGPEATDGNPGPEPDDSGPDPVSRQEPAPSATELVPVLVEIRGGAAAEEGRSTSHSYRRRVVQVPVLPGGALAPQAGDGGGGSWSAACITGLGLHDDLEPATYRIVLRNQGSHTLWLRAVERVLTGSAVPPGRSIAWDVQGPADLVARAEAGGRWRWTMLGATGTTDLPTAAESSVPQLIRVPAGWHTLQVVNDDSEIRRIALVAPPDAGSVSTARVLRTPHGDRQRLLPAELGGRERWRLAPKQVLRLAAPAGNLDRVLRLRLRLMTEPGQPPVHRFLLAERDAAGRVGRVHTIVVEESPDTEAWLADAPTQVQWGTEASIELRWSVTAADALLWPVQADGAASLRNWLAAAEWLTDPGCPQQLARPEAWRSLGLSAKLPYPSGTRSAVVDAESVLTVDGLVERAFAGAVAPLAAAGYGVQEPMRIPAALTTAGEPWILATVPAGPAPRSVLLRCNPIFRADSTGLVAEDSGSSALSLPPRQGRGSALFFLPERDAAAAWSPNRYLPLRIDAEQVLRLPPPESITERDWQPRLAWHQAGELRAIRLRLSLDGVLWWEEELRSRCGVLDLPRPAPGEHPLRVAVTGDATGLSLHLDGDVVGAGGALRLRRAWVLGDNAQHEFAVQRRHDEVGGLGMSCWLRAGGAVPGSMHRVEIALTLAGSAGPVRSMVGWLAVPTDPVAVQVQSQDGEAWLPLGSLLLPLPPALPGGEYTLSFQAPPGLPLAIRCLHQGGQAPGGELFRFERRSEEIDDGL